MLTQIITFSIFFAVIGCILYGRRLIRTEKVDAVFGNPERALGGTHWVIVGSSFLLLIWLYYSWDIAKGFYPKSANELCQVAKVNDSLLGLKYQFPIDEREFKSTSQIKQENKNLKKISVEIQNSEELNNQQKTILISFINKTNQLIPLLTNDDLLENETKQRINNITGKINLLTENFQRPDYPFETEQELNDRLKAVSEEGGWGITKVNAGSGTIENTIEVPLIPATDRGLKFHAAAQELNLISDEFFKLRNHNPQFKNKIKEIKDEIKSYRKDLEDSDEVASTYAKNIVKIARRIEFASIYPPNALDKMQNAIVKFENAQIKAQGGLRFIDILLFPAGTIVAFGSTTVPAHFKLCDDSALSRTTFARLFAVIGTTYGTGDGTTTFNVPDLRDRIPLGKGTNNSSLGGETTGASASAVVATASGSASLTLTTATFATSAKDSSTATAVTGVTAGGHTHNLTLPVQVMNYIIKI